MDKRVNERIDNLKDEIISTTQNLIRIKSVEDEPEEGMPFGRGVNDALDMMINLGKNMGLKTKKVDGYAGHVEWGEGDEIIGVLCHLDVVPEGNDWTYPPYGAEIHDGNIYGRGSVDNKGPAVGALYALKAIKDCGIVPEKRIRVIYGTDEESGWQGLKKYLQEEETPDCAFSPDAEFPAIHGEKGIMIFNLKGKLEQPSGAEVKIRTIKGGNAPNMVPDYCEAIVETNNKETLKKKLEEYVAKTGFKLELNVEGEKVVISSYGISAHGSLPEDGQNAISQLVNFLAQLPGSGSFLDFYKNKIGMEYYGQSIGCGLEDGVSGKLIFNVGMIDVDEEKVEITVNIRYPVTKSREEVLAGINNEIKESDLSLEELSHMEPLYVPKDDPLVKKLMKVYKEFTGDDSDPITIGGGTYARAVEKAVAFGPRFPGQEELAHQKDEYMGIDDLILNTKIYAQAMLELVKG